MCCQQAPIGNYEDRFGGDPAGYQRFKPGLLEPQLLIERSVALVFFVVVE